MRVPLQLEPFNQTEATEPNLQWTISESNEPFGKFLPPWVRIRIGKGF